MAAAPATVVTAAEVVMVGIVLPRIASVPVSVVIVAAADVVVVVVTRASLGHAP